MNSVTPIRTGLLQGVRILGVSLRCMGCRFEWRADLAPSGAIVPETARCPRCTEKTPPHAA